MTPIDAIEALATVLWCYAASAGIGWFARALRLERSAHIGAVTDLLLHLVPVMVGLVLVVLIGAFVGLPSVVVLIAVLLPLGLAYGLRRALAEITAPDAIRPRAEAARIAVALICAVVLIWWRQVQ